MHLTPREQERLLLGAGADLARRRLARGSRLGATEAVALVCDEICEMAWDGLALADIVERAREVVPREQLAAGVASAVPAVQVEALFPHGTVLVHVDAPFGPPQADGPGAVRPADRAVELAPGRPRHVATLHNRGAQAIWVSSHVPLRQVNQALEVRPPSLRDSRLDLPAGAAVRVEPGEAKDVDVVPFGRERSP
ncbi:MAG: urease subunit gamma [Nocardioidaceae bacterium]